MHRETAAYNGYNKKNKNKNIPNNIRKERDISSIQKKCHLSSMEKFNVISTSSVVFYQLLCIMTAKELPQHILDALVT